MIKKNSSMTMRDGHLEIVCGECGKKTVYYPLPNKEIKLMDHTCISNDFSMMYDSPICNGCKARHEPWLTESGGLCLNPGNPGPPCLAKGSK